MVVESNKDILDGTAAKTVRTVFNGETDPAYGMVLGEVINYPGKWSSYPPHGHKQPEIYHYRFSPEQGFGFSMLGDEAFITKNCYTTLQQPDKPHSQTSAPGYAMYYIYLVPHLKEARFTKDSTYIFDEHKWVLGSK
jgi:5-deoxy-glucuronate isomerase